MLRVRNKKIGALMQTLPHLQLFSEFKNKFEQYRVKKYENVHEMYEDLRGWEKQLSPTELPKYKKALLELNRKVNKLHLQNSPESQQGKEQKTFGHNFDISKTYEYFYQWQNERIAPSFRQIDNSVSMFSLEEMERMICAQDTNNYRLNVDLLHLGLLNCPLKNPELLEHIQTRYKYFQEHLCLNVFEKYDQILRKDQQTLQIGNRNESLKKILGTAETKTKIRYKGDFKFQIRQQLSPEHLKGWVQMVRKFILNNMYTEKSLLFCQNCILDENTLKKICASTLKDIFFILGHMRAPLDKLNEKLFDIFELFMKNQNERQRFENMLSLIFYMEANGIQNFSVQKNCVDELMSIVSQNSIEEMLKQKLIYEKEIIILVVALMRLKFPTESKELPSTLLQQTVQEVKQIETSSHIDFQRYLNKFGFEFIKQDPFLADFKKFSHSDVSYLIENKHFLCINYSKICPYRGINHRLNGVGQLVLEIYRQKKEMVKLVNPKSTQGMQKWGQKEEYFKNKLKGMKRLDIKREREFGI